MQSQITEPRLQIQNIKAPHCNGVDEFLHLNLAQITDTCSSLTLNTKSTNFKFTHKSRITNILTVLSVIGSTLSIWDWSVWRKYSLGPYFSVAAGKQLKAGINTSHSDHECWENDAKSVAAVFRCQWQIWSPTHIT